MLTTSSLVRRIHVCLFMILGMAGIGSQTQVANAQLVAFVSNRPCPAVSNPFHNIWIMNADGSNIRPVTCDTGDNTRPNLSPDGSKIAFCNPGAGDENIYVINSDGTNEQQITSNGDDNSFPCWSPDGARIVFRKRNPNYQIWMMNADGSNLIGPLTGPTSDAPTWSPDGTTIAFHSDMVGGNFNIWLMNPDGSNQRQVTFNTFDSNFPAWSPDGKTIAFVANDGGDIFLYHLQTNTQTQLTQGVHVNEGGISWGPDGQYIYFTWAVSGQDQIYKVGVATGTVIQVIQDSYSDLLPSVQLLGSSDTTPPTITITTPANGAVYTLNQSVAASYSCMDPDSSCTATGTVANGSNIDTASVGTKTFTVTATDPAGNTATQSVPYTVAYAVQPLYDQTRAVKSGAVYPIKIQINDANGTDVSSSSLVVHAVSVTLASTNAPGTLEAAGNANPDNDFRFDSTLGTAGGYIFNLKTTGLGTGTYNLNFTVGADPTTHSVQFQVK